MTYSVHDEPDFARVYDDDEEVQVRRGDLRALLDLATGSMDFSSGFWDNEQVEIARKAAGVLGVDPDVVTPSTFKCQYRGHHEWEDRSVELAESEQRATAHMKHYWPDRPYNPTLRTDVWFCPICRRWAKEPTNGAEAIRESVT